MTNRKLLIMEDDPGLQRQMRWCFDGCEVLLASDVKTARTIMENDNPQVLTLDLGLPPDPGGTSQGFAFLDYVRHR